VRIISLVPYFLVSEEKNRRLKEELASLKLEILKNKPDFEFWYIISRVYIIFLGTKMHPHS
jgi:hypothetical protein